MRAHMTSAPAPAGEALYTDPRLVAIYDLFNAGDQDFAFYASVIGAARQRILDLGCGTGTFARRLAAAGHDVVAIDPAPAMIEYAQRQPGADTVRWLACGLDSLPPDAPPFDAVVMTGHAFQCLLTDTEIDATLRAVRRGGVVTYVTCSPHALETSLVVRDVTRLLAREGLSTEILHAGDVATRLAPQPPAGADREMLQLWPHLDGTDAMFCAVLRRTS